MTEKGKKMKETTVLLPAYNEAEAIRPTIDDIRDHASRAKIIVIDNNSSDDTANIARDTGVTVLEVKQQGKGNAIRAALKTLDTKYCIMMDSDYTYPAKHLPEIENKLIEKADIVLGYRSTREQGAMTATNRLGNVALSTLASILYGYRIKDVCTGLWGFRKEALEKFTLTSTRFTLEADLFINAVRSKCRIEQIPIEYRARLSGSKAKLKVWDGFGIAWFLLKGRLHHGRM